MKIVISFIALLLFGVYATPTSANSIVSIDNVNGFTCVATYSDGSRSLIFCPTDVAPVACQCEHLGSQFDDICETTPQGDIYRYRYESVGFANVSQPSPDSPFGFFSCPRGIPPNNFDCTARVTVTNVITGATRGAVCYSN
jgi:hypothetical protein